jgi:hypothetical protein
MTAAKGLLSFLWGPFANFSGAREAEGLRLVEVKKQFVSEVGTTEFELVYRRPTGA